MNDDTIYRQDVLNEVLRWRGYLDDDMINRIQIGMKRLRPAEPETSRIENALHGKSAEEQYDFIWWLLQNYAMTFTDSRQAAIEWLKGEIN